MKTSIIKDRSFDFALRVILLARHVRSLGEYEIARQLLRARTGIGANVEEALAGVSRADFIVKMANASKEARETHYWLRLLRGSKTVAVELIDPILNEADELPRILTGIVKTTQLKTEPNSKLKSTNAGSHAPTRNNRSM